MNYNTFENTLEQVHLPLDIDAMSVYRALEQVQDIMALEIWFSVIFRAKLIPR
jgi:hypothetical protein